VAYIREYRTTGVRLLRLEKNQRREQAEVLFERVGHRCGAPLHPHCQAMARGAQVSVASFLSRGLPPHPRSPRGDEPCSTTPPLNFGNSGCPAMVRYGAGHW
jgi:hypothetical protein